MSRPNFFLRTKLLPPRAVSEILPRPRLIEKLLAFNPDEIAEYFEQHGLDREKAAKAHKKSYGRISRLKRLLETA